MNCGYPQFAPKALDARVMPPDHEEGAETLLRVLELEPPPSLSSKALAFNDKEMSSVLEKMLGPSQQTIREDLVASCDWRLARGPPARVLVNILLKVTEGVNPDAYLREGVNTLTSIQDFYRIFTPMPVVCVPSSIKAPFSVAKLDLKG